MSLFPYLLLPKGPSEDVSAIAQGLSPNPDDAQQIAREPEERPVMATLSEMNAAGEVEYTRDVPLRVRAGVCLPLKAPTGAPNPEQFRLYGIIAEPRDEADISLVKECALVAAAWPWSRGWHDYGYFKPPADKGSERIDPIWQQALQYSLGWREYLREEVTVNLFSQQRGLWKAVLFDPNLAHANIIPGREFSLPRPKGGKQQPDITPSIHWGLCRDLIKCTRVLASKEQTPELDALKEATFEGYLFKRYHAGNPKLDPRGNPCENPGTGDLEFHEVVHESLRSVARIEDAMNHAIRVALAGPENLEEFCRPRPDDRAPRLVRKLVRKQVERVYLELVLNAHKRAVHAQYRAKPRTPTRSRRRSRAQEADLRAALNASVEARVSSYAQQSDEVHRRALAEALRTIEIPAPVVWPPRGEDRVDTDSPSDGTDAPALQEACLEILALARLSVADPSTANYLRDIQERAEGGLRFVVEHALAELKSSGLTE